MKNEKSPGLDGLTVDFFQILLDLYWSVSIKYGYRTGSLTVT